MCSLRRLRIDELLGALWQNPHDSDIALPADINADFHRRVSQFAHHQSRVLEVRAPVSAKYFEDLWHVRRLHAWSYCSAHAMAAKVC
jgi:hypothetical protein